MAIDPNSPDEQQRKRLEKEVAAGGGDRFTLAMLNYLTATPSMKKRVAIVLKDGQFVGNTPSMQGDGTAVISAPHAKERQMDGAVLGFAYIDDDGHVQGASNPAASQSGAPVAAAPATGTVALEQGYGAAEAIREANGKEEQSVPQDEHNEPEKVEGHIEDSRILAKALTKTLEKSSKQQRHQVPSSRHHEGQPRIRGMEL